MTAKRRGRGKGNQSYDPAELSRHVEQIESLLLKSTEDTEPQHRPEHMAVRQRYVPPENPGIVRFSPAQQENDGQHTTQSTHLASVILKVNILKTSLRDVCYVWLT